MKHVRHIEVDQPLDELIRRRATKDALVIDGAISGPRFFRGLMIGLAISLTFYAMLFYALF